MGRIFGTDGVRGLANQFVTAELALDLSVAAAHVLGDVGAFEGHRPVAVVEICARLDVAVAGSAVLADPADGGAGGPLPVLAQPALDGVLELVGQLVAAAGEELQPVVGHRVVAGRDHRAEVGAQVGREERDGRRRQHADVEHVDPGARPTRHDGGGQELAGRPRVTSDHGGRTVPLEGADVAEDVGGRDRQVEGELGREVPVGQASYAVGAEDPSHAVRGADQRLLYCGALRAFFRPYFLRSLTRGSRVRKPAFLSDGRLPSSSISLSARAMARRRAPA